MRVLHFYRTSFPDTMGGVEQVIHQIARGTVKYGVTTDVLSLSPDGTIPKREFYGYFTHRAKRDLQIASTGFSFSAFAKFRALAHEADIVHYHFPWPFMDMVHFAVRVRKPTVVTYHSDIIRQKFLLQLYTPLMRRFLTSTSRIVATSPNYLATSNVLKEYAEKVDVIPIGIDRESYPGADGNLIERWRLVLGPKFFLFVGVLRYYKGLHILIDAAKNTSFPIAIVGAGPIEQELKRQATALGLRNIYFLGLLSDSDKVALLTACHAVIFPSHLRSEAFGVSLLEGAMFGKPMISSEIGTGTTFINIAGETGLVVPPGDADALRAAMSKLWNDDSLAKQLGAAAERRYRQHFTADQMAHSYAALYSNLMSGSH